jgi:two-component system chemotaxis response regulator CheB
MRPRAPAARAAATLPPAPRPTGCRPQDAGAMAETTDRIVAIGSSTGGVQAIESVLTRPAAHHPGIVIVQHMPERFTAAFAERLNGLCEMDVREAVRTATACCDGRVLIAPGGRHMQLQRSGAQYQVSGARRPAGQPPQAVGGRADASRWRTAPAPTRSVCCSPAWATTAPAACCEMRDAGARTAAQDEASSVVFGMPREAVRLGAAEAVLPLVTSPAGCSSRQPSSAPCPEAGRAMCSSGFRPCGGGRRSPARPGRRPSAHRCPAPAPPSSHARGRQDSRLSTSATAWRR